MEFSAESSPSPKPITSNRLLIVEGYDELGVFEELIQFLDLQDIQVEAYAGNDKLREHLNALYARTGFLRVTHLMVHRDAENNAVSAFQAARDAVRDARFDFPVPAEPYQTAANDSLRLMIAIVPPNAPSGMLEDLCLQSVDGDPALACADSYFGCLEQSGTMSSNVSKARAQAFLASRLTYVRSIGIAAKKGYWPFDGAAFEFLRQALTSFFGT